MISRPALFAVALVTLMAGCRLSPAAQATLERWLLCEDCRGGELDSVLAIHNKRALVNALDRALQGPPQNRIENVKKQASATYATILRFTPGPAPLALPVNSATYVSHFANNYVAAYETRAAVALDSIGTPQAQAVLRAALLRDTLYAPVVRRALGAALNLQMTRFAGDSQVASQDALVAIPPAVAVREGAAVPAAPSAPLAGVRVLFTVASGNGRITDSIQLTNTQGVAAVGSWKLGPSVGSNTLRAITAGQVVVFRAFAVYVPVAIVEVAPAVASMTVGDTLQLAATLRDSAGNVLTGRVVTWARSKSTVAAVNVAGLVTAVDSGSATITVTSEGHAATAAITVH